MNLRRLFGTVAAAGVGLNISVSAAWAQDAGDGSAPPSAVVLAASSVGRPSTGELDEQELRRMYKANGVPEERMDVLVRGLRRENWDCHPSQHACFARIDPGNNPTGGQKPTTVPIGVPKKGLGKWGRSVEIAPSPNFGLTFDASIPIDAPASRDARDES